VFHVKHPLGVPVFHVKQKELRPSGTATTHHHVDMATSPQGRCFQRRPSLTNHADAPHSPTPGIQEVDQAHVDMMGQFRFT